MTKTRALQIVVEEAERGLEVLNEVDRGELQLALEIVEDVVLEQMKMDDCEHDEPYLKLGQECGKCGRITP